MKKHVLLIAAFSFLSAANSQINTFNYTGVLDSIQIPNCVDSVLINVWGAQGSPTVSGGTSGKGAYMSGKMDVNPGDWIYVNVGGLDGYNGGGEGGYGNPTDGVADYAGSGGGASDIRIGGTGLIDRKIVAGGGGGAGRHYVNGTCQPCGVGGDGGDGGTLVGVDGMDAVDGGYGANIGGGGKGGTQSAGGAGGLGTEGNPGNPGTLGNGGIGIDGEYSVAGGGGGGGYYGGGSGVNANSSPGSGVAGSGGGGGSSYYDAVSVAYINSLPGIRTGNGLVTITFIQSSPIMTTSVGTSGITLTAVESNATYQWLNCGTGYAIIPGATNQSFTPSANGSYAVELNNGNGCVDTSACNAITEVSLTELETIATQIFPNPADDNIQIKLDGNFSQVNVIIFDMDGRIVHQSTQTSGSFILNIEELNSGVYLLQIKMDDKFISNSQLVKK